MTFMSRILLKSSRYNKTLFERERLILIHHLYRFFGHKRYRKLMSVLDFSEFAIRLKSLKVDETF